MSSVFPGQFIVIPKRNKSIIRSKELDKKRQEQEQGQRPLVMTQPYP